MDALPVTFCDEIARDKTLRSLKVRLQRRIDRDLTERGYPESDVRYRWKNHVQPADELYLQPYKPECDLIIDSTESYHRDFIALENHIKALLENEKSISPR